MNAETLRRLLGWCTVVNFALLLWWWGWLALSGDLMFQMHGELLQLQFSRPVFDTVHYAGMILFKLLVVIFNLVPYLVLRFVFKVGERPRPTRLQQG